MAFVQEQKYSARGEIVPLVTDWDFDAMVIQVLLSGGSHCSREVTCPGSEPLQLTVYSPRVTASGARYGTAYGHYAAGLVGLQRR